MNQATLAWAAFKNMMRAAAHDPVWAITALCLAPFRAIKPVVGGFIFLVIITFV